LPSIFGDYLVSAIQIACLGCTVIDVSCFFLVGLGERTCRRMSIFDFDTAPLRNICRCRISGVASRLFLWVRLRLLHCFFLAHFLWQHIKMLVQTWLKWNVFLNVRWHHLVYRIKQKFTFPRLYDDELALPSPIQLFHKLCIRAVHLYSISLILLYICMICLCRYFREYKLPGNADPYRYVDWKQLICLSIGHSAKVKLHGLLLDEMCNSAKVCLSKQRKFIVELNTLFQ